jgi:N-acetylmuramoyl-L-alanine amidase
MARGLCAAAALFALLVSAGCASQPSSQALPEPATSSQLATITQPEPTSSQPATHYASVVPPDESAGVPPAITAAPAPALPSAAGIGVVVIDAGHQAQGDSSLEPIGPGSSSKKPRVSDGATGVVTHNPESKVNLEVALKLQKVLEAQGVKVVQVRTTQDVNISNSARAQVANKAAAAHPGTPVLFIRLHCDGISSSSANGLSTLIPEKNQWTGPILSESAKAGRLVHAAALSATGASDRGVVTRADLSGFNWAKVPTVLVEMGFMSNATEDRKLGSADYQQKLAEGMGRGIVQYLKSK